MPNLNDIYIDLLINYLRNLSGLNEKNSSYKDVVSAYSTIFLELIIEKLQFSSDEKTHIYGLLEDMTDIYAIVNTSFLLYSVKKYRPKSLKKTPSYKTGEEYQHIELSEFEIMFYKHKKENEKRAIEYQNKVNLHYSYRNRKEFNYTPQVFSEHTPLRFKINHQTAIVLLQTYDGKFHYHLSPLRVYLGISETIGVLYQLFDNKLDPNTYFDLLLNFFYECMLSQPYFFARKLMQDELLIPISRRLRSSQHNLIFNLIDGNLSPKPLNLESVLVREFLCGHIEDLNTLLNSSIGKVIESSTVHLISNSPEKHPAAPLTAHMFR